MVGFGLALIVGAVLCSWLFVGTAARADARGGGTSRITRRSRAWLLAAVALSVVGMALIAAHVVGLWL